METVGDYEYNTKDLIGHGAFAVVFKGKHKMKHDFTVAVKSITKKNLAKSQNLLAKEIKILKELTELHHENVVSLLECKETSHHVYLVMEYCNGGDLADYLTVKGTLSEDTICLFLRQIAAAMRALKTKGIVHRDLKPQNILLCHHGRPNPPPSKIRLKIADFGFARFLHDGIMAMTLCGSPMYMVRYSSLAQTPQALKQLYEKNASLFPKIPSWTSSNLTDLLLRLLKRNAKDRMEFDEFFSHPFLQPVTKPSSPVPIPSRSSLSPDVPSPISSPFDSPISGNLPPSPQGWCGVGSRNEHMVDAGIPMATSPVLDKQSPDGRVRTSSSSAEDQDFVIVPAELVRQSEENFNCSGSTKIQHGSSPDSSPSRPKISSNTSPKMSSHVEVKPHSGNATFHAPKASAISSPRPSYLPVSGTSASPLPSPEVGTYQQSEPIPVPSQKKAYEQIQRSLEDEPSNSSGSVEEKALSSPSSTHMSSNQSSPNLPKHSVRNSVSKRKDSSSSQSSERSRTVTDICSLSPPTVQFTIGTPPGSGRRRNYSSSTPPSISARPTSCQCFSPPPPTLSTSPLQRSNVIVPINLPTLATGNPLSPILGSPIKELSKAKQSLRFQKELSSTASKGLDVYKNNSYSSQRVTFSTRAITLPEICSQHFWPGNGYGSSEPMDQQEYSLHRSRSSNKFGERGFHRTISLSGAQFMSYSPPRTMIMPYHHCCLNERTTPLGSPVQLRRNSTGCCMFFDSSPSSQVCFSYESSPPNTEEPIVFMAPDLPEETILEKEHNETLAKLNFVLALVECVLDLAKSKGNPLTLLTDSLMKREGQMSVFTEGYRRAEQLVLFMRALQLLSSSLQLSRQEVQAGRLSPSTSVRSVLHTMKERFHYCLNMCKTLNSPGTLQAAGVDPTTYTITADQLIYHYAIEMCQSAALEELFGNPEECFCRYQKARVLLHSLAQQIPNDEDKKLLNSYKGAVERRLFVLQSQGYIQAYNTM
ncbi:serine/threonine-protein kinase unc-51-like [Limulus polyphemus]|uniref:Serine/threonine-protein kinase unc-51-like n=1 Tax=Limulus polyphemus TaxID=6850 RepID=A0ABM1SZS3_LIMPO|nr:serine/threonine-protein kinase unc-51-like [Limulus polyphemus]